MKLMKLSLSELKIVYNRELKETFPPAELKPYSAMEGLYKQGRYHTYAAFDDEGAPFGYAFLWSSRPGEYILLDYLGVTSVRRNEGLGRAILGLLAQEFRDWEGILVESEAEEGGPEDAIRRRRLGFYRRNGCRLLDYDAWIFGVHYRTLLIPLGASCAEVRAQQSHREIYHNYFTPEKVRKFVRIPLDPEEPLPPFDWDEAARTF